MKQNVRELAVLGGRPALAEPLHVGRPNIPDPQAVLARVRGALERGWLTNDGPLVRELEERLADYLGVPHCVAMANGTIALEVLARALELKGDVLVPGFTFIATAHAFSWLGLRPVFCDVDPHTHTIDVLDAEARITKDTAAIAAVHLWGGACDVAALTALGGRLGLPVLYDSAHALGTAVGARRVGNFGTAEVFSFHATKFFNTFEGGAVTTHDGALAARLRLMRNFGFAGYDNVASEGTNAKLSEVHAAMGVTMLDHIDDLLAANQRSWSRYARALESCAALRMLAAPAGITSNHQYVVCEVAGDAALTRDQLLSVLWAENVRARRYFFPGCHRTEPYARRSTTRLPVTEDLAERVLVLPAGAAIADQQIDAVLELIDAAFAHADELRDRLPAHLPPGAFKA
jgi:dTDP-4-amino-4,6-dideoxygalactose transaminase